MAAVERHDEVAAVIVMIADLLALSRAAHLEKKRAAGRANKDGIVTVQPDYPTAEAKITEALRYRTEANALDPNHLDPAWVEDTRQNKGVTHEELCAYFRGYLTLP